MGYDSTNSLAPATPDAWAVALCNSAGWPATASNIQFLEGWQQMEGQWGATGQYAATSQHNPLNTTLSYGGSTSLPGTVGIQSYSSWQTGLVATIKTLGGYPEVTKSLAAGDAWTANTNGDLSAELSTWSGGGYTQVSDPSGPYAVGGGSVPTTSAPTGPSPANSSSAPATSTILGACSSSKNYINFPSIAGIGGGGLLNQCNAKALASGLFIVVGGVLVMSGLVMTFSRGKGIMGKITEGAGAGLMLVPGAEMVSAAVTSAGRKTQRKGGSRPRQTARKPSEDELARAHAEGFHKGQTAGPNKKGPAGRSVPAVDPDDPEAF